MKKSMIIGVLGALVLLGGAIFFTSRGKQNPAAEALALCLKEKGVVEYGAYWCPNCQEQKQRFGSGAKLIDYVECAMPGNPRAQSPKCQAAGITGYPTWVFPDGNRLVGLQSLERLAEAAGCAYAPAK
ncbi:MAG: hypothetical protein Q7T01_03970 [bacterium]|nr:hypothetical protein [bacterium]